MVEFCAKDIEDNTFHTIHNTLHKKTTMQGSNFYVIEQFFLLDLLIPERSLFFILANLYYHP